MKILLAIIALSLGVLGQTTVELKARAKAAKANKEIVFHYDKDKDRSFVGTKPYNVMSGRESFVSTQRDKLERGPYGTGVSGDPAFMNVSAGFSYAGSTLKRSPTSYLLVFTSDGALSYLLKRDDGAYFLYDGERLALNPTAGYTSGDRQIAYVISRDELDKLSKAKSIEMRMALFTRKIKPELLQRFQKLLELTAPQ